MTTLGYLIQGIGLGFTGAVQPGPFQTYVIARTLDRGWRRTLPVALAPLISDGPIILLVLLVLNQLPDWLQRILCVAGGILVLYLAAQAFMAWRDFDPRDRAQPRVAGRGVLQAAAMNMLSPGPYIFWSLVTGPILLSGWREGPMNGIGFLAGFYGAMVITLVAIILLFGFARRMGPRVNHALLGIAAVALACFGCYQLWLGVSGA